MKLIKSKLNKQHIVGLFCVFCCLISGKVIAQEQQAKNDKSDKSEIVMTKDELESLLKKIAERRQAKLKEEQTLNLPLYQYSRPVQYQDQNMYQDLKSLQYKMDLLLAQGSSLPRNGSTTTVNVPSTYPSTNYTTGSATNLPGTILLKEQQIFFANNSIALSAGDKNAILSLLPIIKENQSLVVLKGFASKLGNAFYNNQLSYNRANAIKNILVANGVDPGKIIIMYHGADQTLKDSEARRVEIKVEKIILN
jgi:outer membrane protein OmpA-like peptidoglycan-associated protein